MKNIENILLIAAKSDISVLLQGESGAGKEVCARYIHSHSPRKNAPFMALNCGAISRNLTESILEGAKKGAFTGAHTDQPGVVRASHGGTLFLDEIGEMPLDIQCKLLRILQEKAVLPLGSAQSVPVDFRLICATNRDLRHEVAAGRFREDLYFRLNVLPIRVPPLRERDDFKDIAQQLWQEACCSENCALEEHEVAALSRRNWPGNIRQLKNVMQRYALLKPHGISLMDILSAEFEIEPGLNHAAHGKSPAQTLAEPMGLYRARPHWDTINQELENNKWNRSLTARKLGISRGSLNYQIKIHSTRT